MLEKNVISFAFGFVILKWGQFPHINTFCDIIHIVGSNCLWINWVICVIKSKGVKGLKYKLQMMHISASSGL